MPLERAAWIAITLAILPVGISAQAAPKPREFSADAGFVHASGNSAVSALNVGEKLLVRAGQWEHRQQLGSVYGSTDGKESSNLLFLNYRVDRAIGARISAYAYTGWDRNKFAGIRSRFEEALGLSAKLVTTAADELRLEVGYSQNQQEGLTGGTRSFAALRTTSTFKHSFSKSSSFFQSLEYLPNLDEGSDYRFNSESAFLAPLSANVSMKAAYIVRYDNVPEPTKKKSDRILTTGLQVSW